MSLLDAVYTICVKWFTGGKSKYEGHEFGHWMPQDWDESGPKTKHSVSIVDQLDEFRKRVTGG